MPKVNAYIAKREAIRHAENQALIKSAINRDWDMWTIALNREFGFGKERLQRAKTYVNKLYDEYVEAAKTDIAYADEIIDRAIIEIMGDE